jgi:alkylated DNA repair dioxygenase AlkB
MISFAGNSRLRIYGKLDCVSGKRLKKENRVFFVSEASALTMGYRPCAHCMADTYKKWKMELFKQEKINVLPCDGTADYYGQVLPVDQADKYFQSLMETIEWKNDEAIIFGKHIITKRKAAWYGDAGYDYTYSRVTKQALPWTKELLSLKALAEAITAFRFNSCLLNLYNNGDEGVSWHSDDEKSLGPNTTIASLSFGAARKFSFRHKQTKSSASVTLAHGSLLVMKDDTQANWLHSLPKSKAIRNARINLTFRKILQ